jgi:hypothetical protein
VIGKREGLGQCTFFPKGKASLSPSSKSDQSGRVRGFGVPNQINCEHLQATKQCNKNEREEGEGVR